MRLGEVVGIVAMIGLCVNVSCSFAQIQLGDVACVTGVGASRLNLRSGPCTNYTVVRSVFGGESFNISAGPVSGCGYQWFKLNNQNMWAASQFLETCGGGGWNRFGIGLVDQGNDNQLNLAEQLGGNGGWVLLLFAGIDRNSQGPQQAWIDSINGAYSRNLQVTIRLSPPWGQQWYRSESDDPQHRNYSSLAAAFKRVVAGFPLQPNRNLYLQIDNEPDLCYEWSCQTPSDPLPFQELAAEYAFFLSQTIDAIRSIGDARLKVSLGALAPGGALQCGCCGQQNCPDDKPGITGLQYMQAMMSAVPNVFNKIDFLASHSYPAQGVGWGFNVPFDQAMPGLTYYELELQTIQRSIQVLQTETGWGRQPDGLPPCSAQQQSDWTVQAYRNVWLKDNRIMGIMPFILQDQQWGDDKGYGYVLVNNNKMPVFGAVQQLRCSSGNWGSC